jgi:hypothetical protein
MKIRDVFVKKIGGVVPPCVRTVCTTYIIRQVLAKVSAKPHLEKRFLISG